jgi:hypothetical protein
VNIAVFADLHGRALLAFMLCARWQRESGERLTAIFQAGDLAAYPDASRLDRATMRHAQRDEDELGFLRDFIEPREEVANRLAETTCPMIFVRGNHEDHAWLDELEQRATEPSFAIDAYQRIHCLRTGMPYTLSDDNDKLTTLGIGRIGVPIGARHADQAKYAQLHELERLYALEPAQEVDILLTHDVPPTNLNRRSQGMDDIRLALDAYRPVYHFYGHTDEPHRRDLDANGVTAAIRMADLNWNRMESGTPLHDGVMGILRWHNRADHSFEVVDARWLREYSATGWRWR